MCNKNVTNKQETTRQAYSGRRETGSVGSMAGAHLKALTGRVPSD